MTIKNNTKAVQLLDELIKDYHQRAPALVMRDRTSKSLSHTRSRRNGPESRSGSPGLRPPGGRGWRAMAPGTLAHHGLTGGYAAAAPAATRLPRTARHRCAVPGSQQWVK
jgi:hypothetical protein